MSTVTDIVGQQGVVAIVRTASADEAHRRVDALIAAGLRAVEVSLVTPGALEVIRRAATAAPDGVVVGVGTALTREDVRAAADAGARFVVSPAALEPVIAAARDLGLEPVPGAATPTEILQAMRWGSTLVKIFPASLWSPAVLAEMLTALPDLQTVPTGGIGPDTAADWIRAGAVAVGIGGALTRADDPAAVADRLLRDIGLARRR